MPARAAIYARQSDADLRALYPNAQHRAADGDEAEHFLLKLDGGANLRWNVSRVAEMSTELRSKRIEGFCSWVAMQRGAEELTASLIDRIKATVVLFGLVTDSEFTPEVTDCVYEIARRVDGLIFASDSVVDPELGPGLGALRDEE